MSYILLIQSIKKPGCLWIKPVFKSNFSFVFRAWLAVSTKLESFTTFAMLKAAIAPLHGKNRVV
jgi:hypothetical protein